MRTPVAFIIFNRPNNTTRVFEAIREAKPPKLLVVADGARSDRPGEAEKCAATRAIIDRVDWDCEVLRNYSDVNLGCGRRPLTGLNWVFEQVEEAIILEDDCLPHPTFFPFCEELLERYREDDRIATIIGQNVQFGRKRTDDSYYFSLHNRCWGWASWRRAWQNNDFEMKSWLNFRDNGYLNDLLVDSEAVRYWNQIFQDTYDGKIKEVWDYQWTFSCWTQGQLSITPNVNLISNIGFGENATHSKNDKEGFAKRFSNMPTEAMTFPLKHPLFLIRDTQSDHFMQKTFFNNTFWSSLKMKIKKFM